MLCKNILGDFYKYLYHALEDGLHSERITIDPDIKPNRKIKKNNNKNKLVSFISYYQFKLNITHSPEYHHMKHLECRSVIRYNIIMILALTDIYIIHRLSDDHSLIVKDFGNSYTVTPEMLFTLNITKKDYSKQVFNIYISTATNVLTL